VFWVLWRLVLWLRVRRLLGVTLVGMGPGWVCGIRIMIRVGMGPGRWIGIPAGTVLLTPVDVGVVTPPSQGVSPG